MKLHMLISEKRMHLTRMPLILGSILLLNLETFAWNEPTGFDLQRPVYAFEFLSFRVGEGEQTLLEVFGQVPTDDLIFIKYRYGFFASYKLTVSLHGSSGDKVTCTSFVDSVKVKTFKDIDRLRRPQLIRFAFLLAPGEYEARVRLTDLETRHALTFRNAISIVDYSGAELQLSDLQIATS